MGVVCGRLTCAKVEQHDDGVDLDQRLAHGPQAGTQIGHQCTCHGAATAHVAGRREHKDSLVVAVGPMECSAPA